jgi:small subunit ribosomal protein S19
MSRSIWKGPFVDACLLKKHSRVARQSWKIWSRRSCILPKFVGYYAQVYNGKYFVGLQITEDMVGHKFGEFASTRQTSKTKTKQKKKNK